MADHVHKYDEDGDCMLCGDDQWAPKPLPPPLYPWPVRAWWQLWVWLSWPWQVREMKRYGFRRVGWMTWETGPDAPPGRSVMPRDLSTRLLKAGRLSLVFEPRDIWLGLYAGPDAFYLTIVPCLPIRWARKERP